MNKDEILSGLLQELRRGILVLCVLSQTHSPVYGYSLVTTLAEGGVAVEANTLYPLLRRLEGQGLLQSSWETSGAKPRKYYAITPMGQQIYTELRAQWQVSATSVAAFLDGTIEKTSTSTQEEAHE